MIPPTTFVWFFTFCSTSFVVPVVLYNAKRVSPSNTHIESKNQNIKRRMVTKNIPSFVSILLPYFISKDSSNLSKPRFGCYFRCSLVNFKNLIILFLEHMGYIWFMKKLKKYCVWFRTCKKRFVIRDPKSLNSIPV